MSLQRDVVRSWIRLYGPDEARRLLADYYGRTPEGQEEKQRSPHRDRPLEDFIEDVLRDVGGDLVAG